MKFNSKLPNTGTTIFTVMSALAAEHGAINLAQGFPSYSSSPKLIELVSRYMEKGYNQYAPMAGLPALRKILAEKYNRTHGISLDPDEEITVLAGATQGLFTAISTVIRPGDEVILIEPAYDSYRPSVEVNGGVPVVYETRPPDYRVNWADFARLITPKTRMVIINTPHNPTGKTLDAADMEALSNLLEGTDILVLSDEVYEHLIYDGRRHTGVLSHPGLRDRSFAVYSFGKTFHNTGWKIGYCIAPPLLTKEFRKVHQFNVFSVNTPMQWALAEFLEAPEEYLQLPEFYRRKRDFFSNAMQESALKPLTCEGTYFQLFSYGHLSDEPDTEFARRLTIEYGVAAIPVSVFYSNRLDERIIRLCFAKDEEILAEGARRLGRLG
ncbi:MAG TPA: methionine aminotransferase [Flavilitoribacter sp.]|nr:methionine aminotransferase [Flavilitoribacter sp.]